MTVDTDFVKNTVEFIKDASAVLSEQEKIAKAVDIKVPEALQVLKAANLLADGKENIAQAKLANHADVLDMVIKLAEHIKTLNEAKETKEANTSTKAVEAPASYSLGKPTIGDNKVAAKVIKESDRVFYERLGIPFDTE